MNSRRYRTRAQAEAHDEQREASTPADDSLDAPLPPLAALQPDGDPSRFFVRCYRTYGPIFRLPRPARPLTVLAGPEANTFVARHGDEFLSTGESWQAFDHAIGARQMAGARDGEANRQRRAATARAYARIQVADRLAALVDITRECTAAWRPGECVAVLPAMRRIVAEQLGRLLAGQGPGSYLPDLICYLNTIIAATIRATGSEDAALTAPAFRGAKASVEELGRSILDAHRTRPRQDEPDLIDQTLAEAAAHPDLYDEHDLIAAAIGPFLAGIDTVAATCSFLFYALLRHPAVLRRVVGEVDAAFARGPLTRESLRATPALHGAVLETLRLYPVANGHRARVVKPFTFAGCRLEPGDDLLVAMTVPHFLAELFPDPETFDVERYAEPRNEHRQPGAFAPFGLGAHTCLGAGIAEVQLMAIPATVLHDWDLALPSPEYTLQIEHHPTPSPGERFCLTIVAGRREVLAIAAGQPPAEAPR